MANGIRARATHGYVESQDVKLGEHFDELLDSLTKRMEEHFDSQEKIFHIAINGIDKRLDSMNEFRQALSDQSKTFITRQDHEILIANTNKDVDKICNDIESLKLTRAELAGKASQGQLYVSTAISLVALLTGLVSIVFRLMGK